MKFILIRKPKRSHLYINIFKYKFKVSKRQKYKIIDRSSFNEIIQFIFHKKVGKLAFDIYAKANDNCLT